jgi:hypothetical protein
MKAYDLEQRAKRLQKLEDTAALARHHLQTVRALNGQQGYNVSVNGVQITVADMDPRTYQAKLLRGRDMLHLGALKVLQSLVDDADAALHAYQAEIRAEVSA